MAVMRLVLLLLLLAAGPAQAQEQPAPAQPTAPPDPRALTPESWLYIANAGDALGERVGLLLSAATDAVAAAQAARGDEPDEQLTQALERFRLNLEALPGLRSQVPPAPEPAPVSAERYTLAGYLEVARELRRIARQTERLRHPIERGEASIRAATRRIDNLLATYLTLPEAAPERLLRGLQLMASRSALAVAREQQRLRIAQRDNLQQRLAQYEALQAHAVGAITASADELAAVQAQLEDKRATLEAQRATLREAEARAVGFTGESALEIARAALRTQQVVLAAVRERALELEIVTAQLQLEFLTLELTAEDEAAQLEPAQQQLTRASELLARSRADLDEWEDQSERELVALRSVSADTDDRRLRELGGQRLEAAQGTLSGIEAARDAAADTELLAALLRRGILAQQGVVAGGFAAVWSWLRDAWAVSTNLLGASLFKIGETPVTAFGLMRVALFIFVAFWVSRLLRHALERIGSRGVGTESAFYTVGRLAHYAIITAAILLGLSSIGLRFSNLAIVAGALGVGIGFGLQSIVNNFVSGLILLFERSLKVGDYVQLDSGVAGVVRSINVRSTLINTNENLDVLVPNSEFVSGKLTNWTLQEASRRLHIPFGVAYGSDKDKVREAVLEAAATLPYTVDEDSRRKPDVWLVGFGDSSLDFELVVWVKQASVRRPARVQAAYLWAIETALRAHGIEIPFPQRDLHLRSGLERLAHSPAEEAAGEGPADAAASAEHAGGEASRSSGAAAAGEKPR